jgi:type II secretory pathway component PulL
MLLSRERRTNARDWSFSLLAALTALAAVVSIALSLATLYVLRKPG